MVEVHVLRCTPVRAGTGLNTSFGLFSLCRHKNDASATKTSTTNHHALECYIRIAIAAMQGGSVSPTRLFDIYCMYVPVYSGYYLLS